MSLNTAHIQSKSSTSRDVRRRRGFKWFQTSRRHWWGLSLVFPTSSTLWSERQWSWTGHQNPPFRWRHWFESSWLKTNQSFLPWSSNRWSRRAPAWTCLWNVCHQPPWLKAGVKEINCKIITKWWFQPRLKKTCSAEKYGQPFCVSQAGKWNHKLLSNRHCAYIQANLMHTLGSPEWQSSLSQRE